MDWLDMSAFIWVEIIIGLIVAAYLVRKVTR